VVILSTEHEEATMSIFWHRMLGCKHREQADFIGEKVDYLFRQVRHPSGRAADRRGVGVHQRGV
jgi:hypothetical protein